jgi:hypothetical protein
MHFSSKKLFICSTTNKNGTLERGHNHANNYSKMQGDLNLGFNQQESHFVT